MRTLQQELAHDIGRENFDITDDGLYFPRQSVLAGGLYFDRVNGGEWGESPNLLPTEGLAHLLSVALGATPKPAGYYIALFSGAAAPAAN